MGDFRMTKRLRRFLVYPLAATLPALGLMITLGTAAGASTTPSAQATAATIAKAAIERLSIGQHDTNHRIAGVSGKLSSDAVVYSTGWSGYVDTGTGFTEANGSWVEPSATCASSETSLAAFWVGIGGYSSATVEQDGTLIECYEGTAYQYSWWEMYPATDIQVVGETVAAGDEIHAVVARSGTSYTLSVTDSTKTANSFSTTQTCSDCSNTSAEWIVEAPSGGSGVYPLADFGTWKLTDLSVAATSITGTTELVMEDSSGDIEAQPGSLSDDSFTDTWERSS
jgi:hypothetical protein